MNSIWDTARLRQSLSAISDEIRKSRSFNTDWNIAVGELREIRNSRRALLKKISESLDEEFIGKAHEEWALLSEELLAIQSKLIALSTSKIEEIERESATIGVHIQLLKLEIPSAFGLVEKLLDVFNDSRKGQANSIALLEQLINDEDNRLEKITALRKALQAEVRVFKAKAGF